MCPTEVALRNRFSTVSIAGTPVHAIGFRETVDAIIGHIHSQGPPSYIVTPNAHHVVMLRKDGYFKRIYEHALLVVPDGVSLLWAAQFTGQKLKERVNGTDLFETLCAEAAENGFKVFLLGGRPGAAERAAEVLKSRHPGLLLAGICCPPFGFEKSSTQLRQVTDSVRSAKPDLLFVGLGAPKQEQWMFEHVRDLKVPISVGIGVSFELVGGTVTRAPRWMQRGGLEWLFRLTREPGRLWRRYMIGNLTFLALIVRQRLKLLR